MAAEKKTPKTAPQADETVQGTATEGSREKTDGATGPRPRIEWTDDGGPRPEGVEAKVNDPRPTADSDAHESAARDDGPDTSTESK